MSFEHKRFLFAIASCIVLSTALPPNQYQASCPDGCQCERTSFQCRDLGETSTELFRHAMPKIFPELDSLTVTGNNFGILPSESLFGNDGHHERLSLVNLSSNGIRGFGSQTFIDASRVEYFYLNDNRINEFSTDKPLRYLTSLKLLDLTAAFDDRTSSRRRADLIRSLFDSDHDFNDLAEVLLGSNSLEHIHSDTFCRVKSLTRLILRDNSLTSFEFDRNCFRSLSLLDLRNNRIYSLPSTLWKRLPLLNSLDVSRNPLHCDCNLQEFHEFARDDVNAFLAQQETTCASPRSVRGRTIFEIEQNFCRGRTGFFDWLLVFVIIGVIFGAYRFVRGGRVARLRLPFVTKYTQLKETNDETQPAFV
ncbi:hypothetical protein M3Y94_00476500 [Aphelenchoides besseyi]|nr:hypothetical protein M3Y94_00476500 [Aphelenchoides besseyi]KAI6219921.1 LRRCT domain-containing protein [Aphelenchoides besseyi]